MMLVAVCFCREQCEELRGIAFQRHQQLVSSDRQEQLRIKKEIEAEKKIQEKIYDELWQKDIQVNVAVTFRCI